MKCNRCGMMNAQDAARCQSCNAPLAGVAPHNQPPMNTAQDQSGLPAWLETLRAGEGRVAPANSAPAFPSSEFAEEGSLPSWMRSERNEAMGVTGPNAPVSLRPSTQSAPNTADDGLPPSNINVRSLVDEQALPSWMQEGQSGLTPPQQGLAASSLVQSENVPDWMRSLQQQRSVPPTPTNNPSRADQSPVAPAPSADGFSARDLVDQQSLPSWMKQPGQSGGSQPNLPPFGNDAAPQGGFGPVSVPEQKGFSARDLLDQQSLPSWMKQSGQAGGSQPNLPPFGNDAAPQGGFGPVSVPEQKGFSARDLVDQQSLPSWMQQQGGQPASPPATPAPSSASANPFMSQNEPTSQSFSGPVSVPEQKGFSARDLLDQQSLPSWMKQAGATEQPAASPPGFSEPVAPNEPAWQPGQGMPASSLLDMNSLPSWMGESNQAQGQAPSQQSGLSNQNGPSFPMAGAPAQGTGIAASSFIDMNAVPEWMRSQGQGNQSPQPPSAQPFGAPQYGAGNQPFGMPPQQYQDAPFGVHNAAPVVPPRVENVRVPSRPRGEVNPSETSEVAANVFASMLGVASAAPNFSGAQPGPGQQYQSPQGGMPPQPAYGPGPQPGQPPMPGAQNPQSMTGQPGMPYPGTGNLPGQPAMSYPGTGNLPGSGMVPNTPSGMYGGQQPPAGYNPSSMAGNMNPGPYGNTNQPYGPNARNPMGNPPQGGPPSQYPPTAYPGMGGQPATPDQRQGKKRGVFEALREWLAR